MNLTMVMRGTLQRVLGRKLRALKTDYLMAADVVSFDVFDTLVIRDCSSPETVFDIVERRYNKNHAGQTISRFRSARILAESRARSLCFLGEPTIYDIYALLEEPYAQIAPNLLALELTTEFDICRENPEAKELFDWLIAEGKRVVIASDMYLPQDWVAAILEKCGFVGYERLYVSSNLGDTKRRGSMFRAICEDTGLSPSKVLHIGDHLLSDFVIPRGFGMKAFLYCNDCSKLGLFKSRKVFGDAQRDLLAEDVISAVLGHDYGGKDDAGWRMGRFVLGPILLGYSTWLKAAVEIEEPDEVWFLSREGRALMRAYETLYGEREEFRYVNVSRVALCRAVAGSVSSYDEFVELFSCLMGGVVTLGDFFDAVGVKLKDEDLNERGLSSGDRLDKSNHEAVFDAVMCSSRILFKEQRQLLDEYLGVQSKEISKIFVCDIGWAGTMQALLQQALPNIETVGMYLAVSDFHDREGGLDRTCLDRRGYWCEAEEWSTKGQVIRFAQSATEALFLSDEGTTLGYVKRGNRVFPIKGDGGGDVAESGALCSLEAGAASFLSDCLRSNIDDIIGEVASGSAMLPYINTIVQPSRTALEFYSNIEFVDGAKRISFLPKRGLIYYIGHPADALAELEQNNSKVIWLKGLFKLPFPYFRALCFLTSKVGLESKYMHGVKSISRV